METSKICINLSPAEVEKLERRARSMGDKAAQDVQIAPVLDVTSSEIAVERGEK